MNDNYEVVFDSGSLATQNLSEKFEYELRMSDVRPDFIEEAIEMINNIIKTLPNSPPDPKDIKQYGYWPFILVRVKEFLEVHEFAPNGINTRNSVADILNAFVSQKRLCDKAGSRFSPPAFHQLVVISPGVLSGEVCQGIRYESPENLSGWWITADSCDGDLKSLEKIKCAELTEARPDLIEYLALSYQYRFFSIDGFVEKVEEYA
ncbi:hypothetical protein [Deinococcus sp.]|uniref:immunity protein Imm33 domain-containing protein n=1 Tax=Deinococcus sp. TaxID=47478 RepID=UPI0025E3A8EE|nr:hypothetical protein [Deinococcus sp.]